MSSPTLLNHSENSKKTIFFRYVRKCAKFSKVFRGSRNSKTIFLQYSRKCAKFSKIIRFRCVRTLKQVLQPKKTTYAEENSDEITMRHASVQYCNDLQENRRHNFDNRHDISYRTEQDRFEQKFVDYDVTMDI